MKNSEACCLVPRPLYRPHTRRNVLDRSIGYMGRQFRRQYGQGACQFASRWHAQLRSVAPRCALPPARRQAARSADVGFGVLGSGNSRPSGGWGAPSCSILRVCTVSRNNQSGNLPKTKKQALVILILVVLPSGGPMMHLLRANLLHSVTIEVQGAPDATNAY